MIRDGYSRKCSLLIQNPALNSFSILSSNPGDNGGILMKLFDPAIFGPDNDLPRLGVLEREDPLRRERYDKTSISFLNFFPGVAR